jgi:MFS family permease
MSAVRPFECFDRRVIVAALAVAAWLIVSAWLARGLPADSMARVLLALGQAGALAALVVVISRSINRLDELARHIHYQALAVTAAIMVTAITGWAFLERAGLPHIDWAVYAAPAFVLVWAAGVIGIARRYE